jgi:hypothetical protein
MIRQIQAEITRQASVCLEAADRYLRPRPGDHPNTALAKRVYGECMGALPYVFASVGTAMTDGTRIYIDPTFVVSKLNADPEMAAFMLLHETAHVLLNHVPAPDGRWRARMQLSTPEENHYYMMLHMTVNVIMDAVIDDMLVADRLGKMPEFAAWREGARRECVEDLFLEDMRIATTRMAQELGVQPPEISTRISAEGAFCDLMGQMKAAGKEEKASEDLIQQLKDRYRAPVAVDNHCNAPGEGPGGSGGSSSRQGSGSSGGGSGSANASGSSGSSEKDNSSGGSGESGQKEEQKPSSGGGGKESRGGNGDGNGSMKPNPILDRILADLAERIENEMGKSPGTMGGMLEVLLDLARSMRDRKRRPWDNAIQEFLKSTLLNKEAPYYGSPHRHAHVLRQTVGKQVVLPNYRVSKGHLVFVIDTSGSMSDENLRKGALELLRLVEKMGKGHKLTLVEVDAEVKGWETFVVGGARFEAMKKFWETRGFPIRGRGGTVFGEVFERFVSERRERFDAIVVYSDMGIFDLQDLPKPRMPVIWISDDAGLRAMEGALPFGRIYSIESALAKAGMEGPSR